MKLVNQLPWAIQCKLCGKRYSQSSGRIVVCARQDKSMSSVIFDDYEEVAMKLLRDLGVELYNLSDIRRDVFVCNNCLNTKLIPIARVYLGEKSLKEHLLKGGKLGYEYNSNIILIGGVGELGIPEALFLLVEMYNICKQKDIRPIGIPYYIYKLSLKYLREGTLQLQELTIALDPLLEYLREEINGEIKHSPPHVWKSRLDEIETFLVAGIKLPTEIVSNFEVMSETMQDFIKGKSTNFSTSGWENISQSERRKIAQEIIAKAQKCRALVQ